jgi:hypothetical protein
LIYRFAPKGWRTISTNVVALLPVVADVIVTLLTEGTFIDVLPAELMPAYTIMLVMANVYLRTVTTTPLGRRD